jgi:copper chaperone CopZ
MKRKLIVEGLDCANCAAKMEDSIKKLDGVKEVSVNFLTAKLIISGEDEKMDEIIKKAAIIAKDIEPDIRIEDLKR